VDVLHEMLVSSPLVMAAGACFGTTLNRVLDDDVSDSAADGAIGRSSDDDNGIASGESRGVMVQPDVANSVTGAMQPQLFLSTLSRRRSDSVDDVAFSAAQQQSDTAADVRTRWHAPRRAIPHTPLPTCDDAGAQSPASRLNNLLAGPAASRAANLLAWVPTLFKRSELLFHEAAAAPSSPVKRRESASGSKRLPKSPMQKRLQGWASSLEDEKQTALRYADVTSAAQQANDGFPLPADCPLTCAPQDILDAMPAALQKVAQEYPEVNAPRLWTTLCCVAMLEELPVCYLWGDPDLYPETERTIVDAAREWVDAQAANTPELQALLNGGQLHDAARTTAALWNQAWDATVSALRKSPGITDHRSKSQQQRTATFMMRSLYTKHETFAVFLSDPLDGLGRWQLWICVMSLIITQLMVQARGLRC